MIRRIIQLATLPPYYSLRTRPIYARCRMHKFCVVPFWLRRQQTLIVTECRTVIPVRMRDTIVDAIQCWAKINSPSKCCACSSIYDCNAIYEIGDCSIWGKKSAVKTTQSHIDFLLTQSEPTARQGSKITGKSKFLVSKPRCACCNPNVRGLFSAMLIELRILEIGWCQLGGKC